MVGPLRKDVRTKRYIYYRGKHYVTAKQAKLGLEPGYAVYTRTRDIKIKAHHKGRPPRYPHIGDMGPVYRFRTIHHKMKKELMGHV